MFVMQNFIKFTRKEMFPVLLLNYKPSDPLIDMPKYIWIWLRLCKDIWIQCLNFLLHTLSDNLTDDAIA